MPKIAVVDLQKMVVAHTVKAQRYRECAELAGKNRFGWVLREQARREESIVAALNASLRALESNVHKEHDKALVDEILNVGKASAIVAAEIKVRRKAIYVK